MSTSIRRADTGTRDLLISVDNFQSRRITAANACGEKSAAFTGELGLLLRGQRRRGERSDAAVMRVELLVDRCGDRRN